MEMDFGDRWEPRGEAASQMDLRADGTLVIRGGPRGADSSATLRWVMTGCELTFCEGDGPECDPEAGATVVLEGVDASTVIAYSEMIMNDGRRLRTRWKREGAGQPLDCPRPEALLEADEQRRAELADDRPKDALATADMVRRVHPDLREYALIKGQAMVELGRHREARESFEFLTNLGADGGVSTETLEEARRLIEKLPDGTL